MSLINRFDSYRIAIVHIENNGDVYVWRRYPDDDRRASVYFIQIRRFYIFVGAGIAKTMVVEEQNSPENVEKSDSGTVVPEPVKVFTVESEWSATKPPLNRGAAVTINLKICAHRKCK